MSNLKIILIILAVVIASAGVYHFTVHDKLSEDIEKERAARAAAHAHIYSDYNTDTSQAKPAPMPGQGR